MQKLRQHTQDSQNWLQFLVNELAVGLKKKNSTISKPDRAEKKRDLSEFVIKNTLLSSDDNN